MNIGAKNILFERRQQIKDKIMEYDSWKLFSLVKKDILRYRGWETAYKQPGFWIVFCYRISRTLHKKKIDFIAKIIQVFIYFISGCSLSRKAILGPGASVFHPRDIFIGPDVKIGENSMIGPHVFIASNLEPNNPEDYPVIDDGVRIAFGAVILGNVTLGREIQIGPNAVILKDIPDRCCVMSSPIKTFPRDQWQRNKASDDAN